MRGTSSGGSLITGSTVCHDRGLGESVPPLVVIVTSLMGVVSSCMSVLLSMGVVSAGEISFMGVVNLLLDVAVTVSSVGVVDDIVGVA